MSLIPLAWKIGAVVFLIALVTGGYFAWQAHQRALGAAAVEVADAKEVARVKAADAKISALQVERLQQQLADREANAAPVREVVRNAATNCSAQTGPDVDAAFDWVRGVISPSSGGPAARP